MGISLGTNVFSDFQILYVHLPNILTVKENIVLQPAHNCEEIQSYV